MFDNWSIYFNIKANKAKLEFIKVYFGKKYIIYYVMR